MSAASEMDNGSDMDEPMGSQSKVIKKMFSAKTISPQIFLQVRTFYLHYRENILAC